MQCVSDSSVWKSISRTKSQARSTHHMLNLHKHSASCRTVSVLTAGVSTASSLLAFWKKPYFLVYLFSTVWGLHCWQAFQDVHSGPHPQLAQAPMTPAELLASSELISLSLSPNLEWYKMYHNPQLTFSKLRKGKWKEYHPTLFFPSCWSSINLNCQPICIVKS